jgi:Sucrase/ferredoxin-like
VLLPSLGSGPSSHGYVTPCGRGQAGESVAEPMCGTAPVGTAGWLLIEHSGPWPAFGYPADLPAALVATAERLLGHGVRPQLIRRTDRGGRRGDGVRAVFVVGGGGESRWVERVDPEMLTGRQAGRVLRPEAFSAPCRPGWGRSQGALLIVCTHGRREVCCARYGRPVALALAARFGSLVWETTHVGGDRFAANLVLLPQGAYFGRLDPGRAVRVAELALGGELDLDAYRGTAGRSAASQSAEWHLRRVLGEGRIGAVRVLRGGGEVEDGSGAASTHWFGRGHERYSVVVEPCTYPDSQETSCASDTAQAPRGHRLISVGSAPADDAAGQTPGQEQRA